MEEEKTLTINVINPQEDNTNLQDNLISLINKGVKKGTEQIISKLNKDISENTDKLDEIINETEKKVNKPLPMNKLPQINVFNTDGMIESEKRLRRDMIIKIRNYIDCFSDNEAIQPLFNRCGNPVLFKQKLYEKDLAGLTVIYEEIQIGINQSKDFEQFIYMFSSAIQITEFVSSLLLLLIIKRIRNIAKDKKKFRFKFNMKNIYIIYLIRNNIPLFLNKHFNPIIHRTD